METVIFGPPGTGKTTKLLSIVDDSLAAGVHPSRIGFVSFSKKAAEEAKTRALEKFGLDSKYFTNFRTLHSMAFNFLGLQRSDVMKGSLFNDFGAYVGMQFTGSSSVSMEEGVLFAPGFSSGDKYLNIINKARGKMVPVLQEFDESNNWSLSRRQLTIIDEAYREFKAKENKMDFVDMIEHFIQEGDGPELDLLIVDEAQDLVPLQWKMVKDVLVPRSENVFYAGDDDQCIYDWMGVNVSDFMDSCDNVMVLDKSYRLSAPVYNIAQSIVKKVSHRQEKHWSPGDHDGSVEFHYDIMDLDLTSGEWLILGRTNKIVNEIGTLLKDQGYVYWREGSGWSISPKTLEALEVWLRLCRGERFSAEDLKRFGKFLRPEVMTRHGKRKLNTLDPEDAYSLDDITSKCNLTATRESHWADVIKVAEKEEAYITSVRRSGEKILGNTNPRIRISTIHKAKGGEADNVAVITAITTDIRTQEEMDSESRCFYVATTRARKHLHIIEGSGKRYEI